MVPSTRPVAVSPCDSSERAIPKSVTFARPSGSIRTFWGLTSRWTSLRLVRGLQPAADLDRVGDRLVERQPALGGDPLLQRLARDVLEDDVGAPVVLAGVDDADQVGMRELGDRPRLAAEALELVLLVGDLAVQHLDRDGAVERLVDGQVDGGHAAAAQLRLQPVAAGEHRSDHRAAQLIEHGSGVGRGHHPGILDERPLLQRPSGLCDMNLA